MTTPDDPHELHQHYIARLGEFRRRMLRDLDELDARINDAWYEMGRIEGPRGRRQS